MIVERDDHERVRLLVLNNVAPPHPGHEVTTTNNYDVDTVFGACFLRCFVGHASDEKILVYNQSRIKVIWGNLPWSVT